MIRKSEETGLIHIETVILPIYGIRDLRGNENTSDNTSNGRYGNK